jgi:hypothetical protein
MAVLKQGISISSTQFSEHKESSKLLFYEPVALQLPSKCDTLKTTYSGRKTKVLVQHT